MADRFKIGEGFVTVETEDDTPKGLARIKGSVDRFIDDVQTKVKNGLRSGFDAGADEAAQRMARFTRDVTGDLDRIAAKRTKIDLDIMNAATKIVQLRKEAETATVDRKMQIDAEIAAASANMKVLKREAEDLDGKKIELEAKLRNGPETIFEIEKLDKSTDNFLKKALSFTSSVGSMGAGLAGLLSLLGPVTNGIVGAVTATGNWLVAVSPLVALLPGFAASLTFLITTVKQFGPAFTEALSPVSTMFQKLGTDAGVIAVKGVEDLANSFVRLNAPVIASSMNSIATAVNGVAVGFGNWLTSAEGTQAVQTIVTGVSDAVEKLAPHVTNLAIEFGKFIARVGDPVIGAIAQLLANAADATARWVSTLQASDIEGAFSKIRDAASGFVDKIKAAKDVIQWLADHKDAITGISDALAGIGIVVGAATGNWVAVVAGAVTLILNHFDTVKTAASGVGEWFSNVFSAIANDPWVQVIIQDLGDIAEKVRGDLASALDVMRGAWEQAAPAVKQFWEAFAPVVHAFLESEEVQTAISTMAVGLFSLAAALGAITVALGGAAAAFTVLDQLIIAWAAGAIIGAIKTVFSDISDFIGSVVDAATTAWTTITEAASSAWDSVISFIETIPGRMSAAWASVTETTSSAWESVISYLSALPGRIMAYISQIASEAPATIGRMAGELVGHFIAMGLNVIAAILGLPGQVANIFNSMKEQANSIFNAAVAAVVNAATTWPGKIGSALSSLASSVAAKFNAAKEQAISIFNAAVSGAVNLATSLPGKIGSALSSLGSQVQAKFNEAKTKAITTATALVNDAVNLVKSLPSKAASALGNLGSVLANAGRQLIQGFIDGITSMIPSISGALSNVTSKLPDWKGPAERDRTILEPAGRLVMAGLVDGIGAGRRELQRQLAAVTDMIGQTSASMTSAASRTSSSGGPVYQFAAGSVTLDASNVRSIADLVALIEGVQGTARQYGAVPRSA